MKIRLFPQHFLQTDRCFGLLRAEHDGELDPPVTIEGDTGIPIHIIHSDPEHLAYLVGLIVLQAWTSGISELGKPPSQRRAVLVVTDKPGKFGEAYLRLNLPGGKIRDVDSRRRLTFYEKTGHAPLDKSEYLYSEYLYRDIGSNDARTRLHNFFPLTRFLGASGLPG